MPSWARAVPANVARTRSALQTNRMMEPPASKMRRGSGPRADDVREPADAGDVDVHHVAGRQAEVVRRHDAGSRQEDGTVAKGHLPAEPVDQPGEAALHGGALRRAVKRGLRAALDDQ